MWIEKYKAFIITTLITGIVVFAMFSIHITQSVPLTAETYIDISPAEIPTETTEKLNEQSQKISSNKAFNEDAEFKELMKNFKTVNQDDLKALSEESELTRENVVTSEAIRSYHSNQSLALNEAEKKKYESLKKTIENTLKTDELVGDHSKDMSSLTYSLKDRSMISYKTPRYLCEFGGKVVVTIRVNANGEVIDTTINQSTNTSNQCLIDNALDYAKSIIFNSTNRSEQIGTVTFYFKNKSN